MSAVYYIAAPDLDLVKIGFAIDPTKRLAKINSDSPAAVVLLATEPGSIELERERHRQFGASRRRGEWFQLSGPVSEHIATLAQYAKPDRETPCKTLAEAAGISLSYSSMILTGDRTPSRALALRIWRKTGRKFPPIAHLSDDDLAVLDRIEAKAA